MKEVSVYIHIPFCVQKCFYCDFLSGPADEKLKQDYIKALICQIEKTDWNDRVIKSIFIGGGTPSVLPSFSIGKILCKLREAAPFLPDCEISIEVNPGTVDRKKLRDYRQYGINRLSIGLQSADNRELKLLGRIHTYEDFLRTFREAREENFNNLNIDLISSIPGQSVESFCHTLQKVVSLSPEHMSVYSLILEEGTEFYRRRDELIFPDEDTVIRMDDITKKYLRENNYARYEISNYAKPGMECRHNSVYWQRGTYIGFGVGAASLIEEGEEHRRYTVLRDVNEYVACMLSGGKPVEAVLRDSQILSEKERMEEFMYLGLRMTKGISARRFYEAFHVPLMDVYGDIISRLCAGKWMETGSFEGEERCYLTEKGLDVSNVLMAEFLLP